MKIIIAQKHSSDGVWYNKILESIIKLWTRSKYYHSEIIIENKWITSDHKYGLYTKLLLYKIDKTFDYFLIEVPEISEEQQEIFWRFLKNNEGTGYDWKGIFLTQGFRLNIHSHDKWFCSEIVAKILQMLYKEEFLDVNPATVSPGKLDKLIKDISVKMTYEEVLVHFNNSILTYK